MIRSAGSNSIHEIDKPGKCYYSYSKPPMTETTLKRDLIRIVGEAHYLDAKEERLCYAYDATGGKRLPDAVVFPGSAEEISEILKLACRRRFIVVPRGAGSGFSGGSVPYEGGVVMVTNRLNRILEIDTDNLAAVVEPGVITAEFHKAVEEIGLFYPPDPASMAFSTLGGNIAENAGGMRAVKYGVTKDYVMGLQVVLPTGEIIETGGKCVKDVVGYNLTQLFVGSEGTLGVVTRAVLKLLPLPAAKNTLTAAFPAMPQAAETVSDIIKNRIIPTTIEFLDQHSIRAVEDYLHMGLPGDAGALLLIEVDGETDEIDRKIHRVREVCERNGAREVRVATDKAEQAELWKARRSVTASLMKIRPKKLNEDIAVPRARIPDILIRLDETARKHDVLIVNFGHAGDGHVHVTVLFDNDPASEKRAHAAVDDVFRATVELGGRISGEHGIGLTKRKYMSWCLDANVIAVMRRMKTLFDPHGILNPGKMFPATETQP